MQKTVQQGIDNNSPIEIIYQQKGEIMISASAFNVIAALNLQAISSKMEHPEAGEGWSGEKVSAVEREYRRFLYLMKMYPKERTSPGIDVDTYWHYHILDTKKYAIDCQQVFGYFLHHNPYIGLRGEGDEEVLRSYGRRMRELHYQTFGDMDNRAGQAPAWCAAEASSWCAADTALEGRKDAQTPAWCAAEAPAWCAAETAVHGRMDAQAPAWCAAETTLNGRKDAQTPAWCAAEASAWCAAETALNGGKDAQAPAWCAAEAPAWCAAEMALSTGDNPGNAAHATPETFMPSCSRAMRQMNRPADGARIS